MARETTLTDVIAVLNANAEHQRESASEERKQIAALLVTQNKTFEEYFKGMKRDNLDDLEKEKKKKGVEKAAGGGVIQNTVSSLGEGLKFGGLLLSAVGAFVSGFISEVARTAKNLAILYANIFKKLTKPLLAPFMAIGRVLRGGFFRLVGLGVDGKPVVGTSKFVKYLYGLSRMSIGDAFRTLGKSLRGGFFKLVGLGVDGKPVVGTNKFVKFLYNAGKSVTDGFTRARNALVGVGNSIRNFFTSTAATAKKRLTPLTKLVITVSGAITTAFGFVRTAITGIGTTLTNLFRPFVRQYKEWRVGVRQVMRAMGFAKEGGKSISLFGKVFKGIGGFFNSLRSLFKPVMTLLKTVGRVVAFPITIIMGIIDAVTGAIEGFKQEGFLGGILGAIGGLARGIIGMPLDLLKDGISWIAGKLGFENFSEMLDSFSFSEMIFGMFMKVAEIGNGIIDNLFGGFEEGFGAGMKQMLGNLLVYVKRFLLFPVAIAAGAAAALGALLPGGKSPLEAFSDTFSSVLKAGEGSVLPDPDEGKADKEESAPGTDDKVAPKKPRVFETQEKRIADLKAKDKEGKVTVKKAEDIEESRRNIAEAQRESVSSAVQVNTVNAPSSVSNSTNNAMFGDPQGAMDPTFGGLDRRMAW